MTYKKLTEIAPALIRLSESASIPAFSQLFCAQTLTALLPFIEQYNASTAKFAAKYGEAPVDTPEYNGELEALLSLEIPLPELGKIAIKCGDSPIACAKDMIALSSLIQFTNEKGETL